MKVSIPLTPSEIEKLQDKITSFARLCGRYDSLGRVYAWIGLSKALHAVVDEEVLHSFKFPSPTNPQRDMIISELHLEDQQ